MKMRRALLPTLVSLALLGTSACGALEDGGGEEDRISVAAGFYPLAWVAEKVAGDHAQVVNLTRPGQDAHDSELSMANTGKLAQADLVLLNGGFQPAIDDTAAQNAEGEVLDVADLVDFRTVDDHDHDHDHEHATQGHDANDHESGDHDAEDDHALEEGHSHDDGHDHGDEDPHFWLDPLLMADVADGVADALGDVDPDNAPDYEAAAQELRAELTDLDAQYEKGLAQCERDTVVVSHDAFGYLSRYGLHFEPIAGLTPGAEPTPADLARLQDLIREEGLTTVFTETLAPPELAGQLADDMGVETAVLDPIEGLVDSTADEDYLSLMEKNLEALKKANGC